MRLSFRTRQFLRGLIRLVGILALVALLVLLCWVLWLRRFIVYTADGVVLDFSLSQEFPQGQTDSQGTRPPVPDIFFSQTQTTLPPVIEEENPRFNGYYVTLEELQEDTDYILAQIRQLPADTPVLLDVKGYWGYFYYSSALGDTSSSFDAAVMDDFFEAVNASGAYTIARLPAFRDYAFAADHNACGLKVDKGYLWVDENRCYWLDPANDQVLSYLVSIIGELREMGFDEVAFTNFCFPDTDQVAYPGDKEQALQNAAASLVTSCARDDFAVSFITDDPDFPLPAGNCRLYLTDVVAAEVQNLVSYLPPEVQERAVLFVQSYDTRFEAFGTIRPLKMAE